MASRPIDRDPVGELLRPALVALFALSLIGLLYMRLAMMPFITTYFFIKQDIPTVLLVIAFAILMPRVLSSPTMISRLSGLVTAVERVPVWALAVLAGLIGAAGAWLVFGYYPVSMDEFWARADGRILAQGAPMARVPAEWLPYATALQPTFLRLLPQAGLWSSAYLPVNALIQLAFGPFASPLLAAVSIVLVASIARQLMPEHRCAPLISALLLASSTQLLITQMTPYAMTAHLAFNLAWLWLFLRRSPLSQIGAMAVGFLATGLHQFAFFPLFALPFLAESFLSGQRRWAVAHALVIAAAVLAWSNYDGITAALMHATAAPGATRDTGSLFGKMLEKILGFDLWTAVGLTAVNLLRFQLWQNPLAIPLAALAAWKVVRVPGPLRAAFGGIVLIPLFMLFVLPFQGHGWGYRYLHGLLGNLSLLATYGWFQVADRRSAAWRASFAAMLVFSLALLLPLRAYQAWHWAVPYVAANRALNSVDADVVVIDAPYHAYTQDLVRNSPLLDNTPKRLAGSKLDSDQLAQLCSRYRVQFFTDDDAKRYGIVEFDVEPKDRVQPLTCGS